MKSIIRNILLLAVVALLWLVPSGFAGTVGLSLDSSVLNNPIVYGEYVAPYSANNGSLSVICDDIKDDQYVNHTYQFNLVNYNAITYGAGTNVMFGNDGTIAQAMANYGAAAWLMQQLLLPASNKALYTWAIWDVFDDAKVATMGLNGSQGGFNYADVKNLVATAMSDYGTANLSDVTFWVPDGCAGHGVNTPCMQGGGGVQEFGQVPEGGAAVVYLLLGGISCFGAMFYSRRQTARADMA